MFLQWLSRLGGVLLLSFAVSLTASAQYGGGGGGGTGTGSMGSGYGSSHAKAIGIGVGVGAAAAVGIVLYVHHRHHQAQSETQSQPKTSVMSRTEANRFSLNSEKYLYRPISIGTPLQLDQRTAVAKGVTDPAVEATPAP